MRRASAMLWCTLMSHVWLDADLRVIRLMGGSTDRNVGRFGAGARYRF
jgi:hypothetical protein